MSSIFLGTVLGLGDEDQSPQLLGTYVAVSADGRQSTQAETTTGAAVNGGCGRRDGVTGRLLF